MTKKYKAYKNLFLCLSILCIAGPLIYYTVKAFMQGEPVEKFCMGMMFIVAVIFTAINVFFKVHFRSTIWLVLIGIYVCIDKITALLIIMAITTLLDELVCTPLYKKYKNLYIINREIDKR